jgi:3-hydroxybenzoate/4-hydroxybenzoate---CoA ligase
MNAAEHVLRGGLAAAGADGLAIVGAQESLTYAGLIQRVGRLAAGLRAAGLRPGDRVALLMLDTPDLAALHLAVMAAGGIAVALSGRSALHDLRRSLALVRPAAIAVDREFAPVAELCLAAESRAPLILREDDLARWKATEAEFAPLPRLPADPAFWVMTSGTTGDPKAVEHRHDNVLTCERFFVETLAATPADRFFATSRLNFSYALGTMFGVLRIGATLVLHAPWPNAAAVAETVARHRPTIMLSVPALYHMLLDHGAAKIPGFAAVRCYVSAGERLPPKIAQAWAKATGVAPLDALGCSETVYKILTNTPAHCRAGSSGYPAPGAEVRLVGEDGAPIDGVDQPGMLEVRLASVCAGYRTADMPPNAPTLRPPARFRPDGWFATGDVYVRDADGFFHHRGRSDDMLKIAGQWVSPTEIEDALGGIPAIAEVAVVAAKTVLGLTEVVLHVVPSAGIDPQVALAAAQEQVARLLPSWKRPRRFVVADTLPRTQTGKMQRHRLRHGEGRATLQ